VREVDEYARQLFSLLEKHGVIEDSVVIITADHGDEFADHNGLSHDGKFYSELINVPFFIYHPARTQEEVQDTLVSNLDIPPTIVHLFGVGQVEEFKGHSIIPLGEYPKTRGCFGEAVGKRSAHEKKEDRPTYYFHDGQYKVIYTEGTDTWEMYDMKEDPGEHRNVVDTSPVAEKVKKILEPRIRRWEN